MIYIGKFLHATNQQNKSRSKRRHGEFSLLVSASLLEVTVQELTT